MRIRCSKGLRISAFYGHFFIRSTDLLALPACDVDKVGGCGLGGQRSRRAPRLPCGCPDAGVQAQPGRGGGCSFFTHARSSPETSAHTTRFSTLLHPRLHSPSPWRSRTKRRW